MHTHKRTRNMHSQLCIHLTRMRCTPKFSHVSHTFIIHKTWHIRATHHDVSSCVALANLAKVHVFTRHLWATHLCIHIWAIHLCIDMTYISHTPWRDFVRCTRQSRAGIYIYSHNTHKPHTYVFKWQTWTTHLCIYMTHMRHTSVHPHET